MSQTTNVLICGVGGQGVLLASELVAQAALIAGLDVKKAEVHGMAQRGGSVESHVRFGASVASPLVAAGTADLLLGLEPMEALRSAHYLHEEGMAVLSTNHVVPPSIREEEYPTGIEAQFHARACRVRAAAATDLAQELGNPRAANVILLGLARDTLPLAEEVWQEALRVCLPQGLLDLNQKAFARGEELAAGESADVG